MTRLTQAPPEAEGNSFSSMIDVVFLLLIYFVVQPFKAPEGILPSPLSREGPRGSRTESRPEPMPLPPLHITITPDGKGAVYHLSGREVRSARQLPAAILGETGGATHVPIVLAPDGRVAFSHVFAALDQCHVAGMAKVAFSQ